MRKFILSAFILGASFAFSGCGESKQPVQKNSEESGTLSGEVGDPSGIQTEISESDLSETLRYLASDELAGRMTGTKGIEKAALHIEDVFRENDLKPYFRSYRDSFQVQDITGYNLVTLKEGNDPELKNEYIIIGAHYDHIGAGKPVAGDTLANGANDNASGTAAVLELAKQFTQIETSRSLLFALYSAEELGLQGSKHLAQRLHREGLDLYVMLSIEMIGVPMKDKDYTAYLTGYEVSNLGEKFNLYSGKRVLGLLPQAKEYNLFRRSDNFPFFREFQVPAHTISTFDFTNYDYYHHVDDEFEHMDISHMTRVIRDFIPGIAEMANNPDREIKMIN